MRSLLSNIPEKNLPQLRRRLLSWYRRNKRDLDWRRTRDAYHIWVSEIMLQQTRVAAVIPYYQRFLKRFPTLRRLARAPQEAVLQHWAGLGYYNRARNLQHAAQLIVARHRGEFPRVLEDALALPGVGEYTAAAVLSIAYDEPLAVLDGNVARVLARWGAVRGDLRRPRLWRRLSEEATRALSREEPGDWNQAMMELGATVCTPVAPRCADCPVARWCRAHAIGIVDRVPVARRTPATVGVTLAAAVLLDPRGRTLLLRDENRGGAFFSRLWQFPAVEASANHHNRSAASGMSAKNELARYIERRLRISAARLKPLATAKHTVTFHNIRLAPYMLRLDRLPMEEKSRATLLSGVAGHAGQLPVSGATRKIARAAMAALTHAGGKRVTC